MQDAWKDKPKRQCNEASTIMRGTLKAFHKFSNVFYLTEVTYGHIQNYADLKALSKCKNATVNVHIQRLRRFLKFCGNQNDWIVKNEADSGNP